MSKKNSAPKQTSREVSDDIYGKVTDRILSQLEKGVKPWEQPWLGGAEGGFPIRHNREAYKGINILLLWLAQEEKGYRSNQWLGFNQAKALEGTVRKGEKGTMIVFYSPFIPKAEKALAAKEKREPKKAFMLKSHVVFNVDQIDGLPEHFYPKDPATQTAQDKIARIDHAETFFKKTGSVVKIGRKACYVPSEDYIEMPAFEKFANGGVDRYYSTLCHEHVHWTGAKSRLNRDTLANFARFGDESYAMEELVAEMGAAFGCAFLGINLVPRADHADYLAHWIKVLKADKKVILSVASHAQKAVKFLAGEKEVEQAEEEKAAA